MWHMEQITYWRSVEFDGDYGKNRMTRKFDSDDARRAWNPQPMEGEGWSDFEEWETTGDDTNAYRETARFGD